MEGGGSSSLRMDGWRPRSAYTCSSSSSRTSLWLSDMVSSPSEPADFVAVALADSCLALRRTARTALAKSGFGFNLNDCLAAAPPKA